MLVNLKDVQRLQFSAALSFETMQMLLVLRQQVVPVGSRLAQVLCVFEMMLELESKEQWRVQLQLCL